jgi:tetratricopeptide (TPR) repeat protein
VSDLIRGNKLLRSGRLEDAVAAYQRAVSGNPAFHWSHCKLGEALEQLGRWEDAIASYRKAVELNPNSETFYQNLKKVLAGRNFASEEEISDKVEDSLEIEKTLIEQKTIEETITEWRSNVVFNQQSANNHLLNGLEVISSLYIYPEQLAIVSGKLVENGIRKQLVSSTGNQGLVSFGPYISVPDGLYHLKIDWQLLDILENQQDKNHHSIGLKFDIVTRWIDPIYYQADIYTHQQPLELLIDILDATAFQIRFFSQGLGFVINSIELSLIYQPIKNNLSGNYYFALGKFLQKQGQLEKSIAAYWKAAKLNPHTYLESAIFEAQQQYLQTQNGFGYFYLGLLLIQNNQPEEAFILLEKALAIQPKLIEHNSEILLQEELNDFFSQLLSLSTEYKHFWHLGGLFASSMKWEEAINAYHKALTIKPEIAIAYSRLTQDLGKRNEIDYYSALRSKFFKLILTHPGSSELYMCLGKFLASKSRFMEAIEIYQKAISHQPQSSILGEIYSEIGQAFLYSNQLDQALNFLEKSLQYDVVKKETYMAIGHIYALNNNVDLTIDFFKKALSLDSKNSEYHIHLGHFYCKINNLDLAISCYKSAIENPPVHHHAYISLVNCLIAQGKSEEAISILQELVSLNIPFPYTEKLGIAQIMKQVDLSEEADTYLQKLQIHPPIQDIINSVKDWAITSSIQVSNYKEIHPPHIVKFSDLPKTIHKDLDPRVVHPNQFESPKTFVVIVPKGRYCAWDTTTAAITSDNKLLNELTTEFQDPHHIPAYHIEGTVAALSVNTGNNYYHWLYDMLPRFGLLELSGIDIDSIDKFLVSGYFLNAQKETLEILGIPTHKIIDSVTYPHIKADRLVVPSYPGIGNHPTKWMVNFLREKFSPLAGNSQSKHPERIYLTRRSAKSRKIINEYEVLTILQEYGFTTIDPATKSIAELAPLMANAKVVIGYGAGNANLFLCSPGTKVIELFSPYFIGPNYRMISHYLGLDYYYLIGAEGIVCPNLRQLIYHGDGYVDNLIDLDSLKQLFNLAGVEPRRREV